MSANRIQIKASLSDKKVTIPLGQIFDEVGREQLLEMHDQIEQQNNINYVQDYETTRYTPNYGPKFEIYYEFEFWDDVTTLPGYPKYVKNFNILGYKNFELARNSKSFTRSFFKFDFFDSPIREKQKLMFSTIMPTNNCRKKLAVINQDEDPTEYWAQRSDGITLPVYEIYKPAFSAASAPEGTTENYYLQWLKDRELFSANTFYMTCKFFNARTGTVMRMLNQEPTPIQGNYNFEDFFYYQIILNIEIGNTTPKYNYTVHPYNSVVGATGITLAPLGETVNGPIKFYEFVTT
tara:strand:- start:38568 stop:39446 length:879 start_codon:yes stop_codon:yes gene_type:complete